MARDSSLMDSRIARIIDLREETPRQNSASNKIPARAPSRSALKLPVFLVYEDQSSGAHAVGFCRQITAKFAGRVKLVCAAWRYDVLHLPIVRKRAEAQLRGACLVALAVSGGFRLTRELRAWIESGLPRASEFESALVVMAPRGSNLNDWWRLRDDLREMARRARLGFFASRYETPGIPGGPHGGQPGFSVGAVAAQELTLDATRGGEHEVAVAKT